MKENPLEEFGIQIQDSKTSIELDDVIEKMPEVASYEDLQLADSETPEIFQSFSQYPYIVRDIAVWISEDDSAEELKKLLVEKAGDLLKGEPRLVDEYAKDGRVSFAHRLIFQSEDKTLTDEEVNASMKDIEEAISQKGWEVR